MRPFILGLLACSLWAVEVPAEPRRWEVAKVTIDAGFPGANAIVDGGAGDEIRVRQDWSTSREWWFHWSFRVQGAAGRSLTFHFTDGKVVGVRGPAVSTDDGLSWRWLDAAAGAIRDRFTFAFPADRGPVRFAMGIPHQQSHWELFAERYRGNPAFAASELCRTGAAGRWN